MPQKTNLNINPYFDDFDASKNFYKVLFKPGYPVQARELTTLQSYFQHQLESFGSNLFKEGSMVIPGSITYDRNYDSVKINQFHLGIDVSLYIKNLVGKRIQGQSSGITATIKSYAIPPTDGVEDIILYVKYSSSSDNLSVDDSSFFDGEILITLDNVTYGNTTINAGGTIANVLDLDATSTGSAVGITSGVYFIRGTFVDVASSLIVLDPFSVNTSYRVGLNIFEEIITSDDDPSLYDNAKGFSNYAAPGADRLKISTTLTKKLLDDNTDDKNFVELLRIENGEVKKLQDKSSYSIIKDYLAERTYDESGDYTLGNFNVDVLESLNDEISNEGIYLSTQKTSQGNTPSDDLLCLKISPGKAYVRGFDVNFPSTTIIDLEKPRETKSIGSSLVPFEMGNLLRVNNASGTPYIGINDVDNFVYFYNQRRSNTGTPDTSGNGDLIGQARVYNYSIADNNYNDAASVWNLYLFDVQTYTKLTINNTISSTDCPEGSYIRGLSSGASGYTVSTPNSNVILLSQTSGNFISGEQILINESNTISRSIVSIVSYSVDDIKSVYQNSTALSASILNDFSADAVLKKVIPFGFSLSDKLEISSGIATSPGKTFTTIKPNTIIRYQKSVSNSNGDEAYARVISVSNDGKYLELDEVLSIDGICDGSFSMFFESSSFYVGVPYFENLNDGKLYAPLENKNISSLDLKNSNLIINTQIGNLGTNSNGELTLNVSNLGIGSAFFLPFSPDRYSVFYSDGEIEDLTFEQVNINQNGTQLFLTGLKPNQSSNVLLNVSLIKNSITSKSKTFSRSEKVLVNKTSSGLSTSTSGLTFNNFYGLRIEDSEISLNVPDAVNLLAVYESLNNLPPVLDKLTFSPSLNLNTASVLGEKIKGSTSGAIAQIVTRVSASEIEIVYLNSKKFVEGELVNFTESNISSALQVITNGFYQNITNNYILDKGQKEQYYDYSKIVRKQSSNKPSRQILIIFDCYKVPTNDNGDLFTVESYTNSRYQKDIPLLKNNTRATDVLDFRPRVVPFTVSNQSPFAPTAKAFETDSTYVVAPNESSILTYNYYLPRTDKLFLDKNGNFKLIKGISADSPKEPANIENAMNIATIFLPAYVYSASDVGLFLNDNKRYTMRDIGSLEERISNLEVTTSLSLLELDTKTLHIKDSDGYSRYKTGFFVDDFKNNTLIEKLNSDVKCDVDTQNKKLIPAVDFWSLKYQLGLRQDINPNTADISLDLPLQNSSVRKTGDLITLNYEEKGWIEQPLASNIENVNPFNVIEYSGGILLNPSSDNWVRNVYIENIKVEGSRTLKETKTVSTDIRVRSSGSTAWINNRQVLSTNTTETNYRPTRTGNFDYVDSIETSTEQDPYIRSRNVEFRSSGLKGYTQHYAFLDDVSSIDIIPKLIEITMQSGSFSVGENIIGYSSGNVAIIFRACQPNHKFGSYNNPTAVYTINPYNRNESLITTYSASSTVLNVDTTSLAEESFTKYGGYIEKNMQLVGETSGAIAYVKDIRLVSDNFGDILGSFFIREPNTVPPPLLRFKTGQKTFRLNAYSDNSNPLPGQPRSSAQTNYLTSGIVEVKTTNTVQVRNPPPPPPPRRAGGKDPLAQSFTVDETGAFLTSVDLYFATKDPNERLYVELRTVELGTPTDQLVQDYARVILEPSQINTSDDASVATNIKFPSPIYLEPRREYALVILAPTSDSYNLWVGTMGQKTVNTRNLPDAESAIVTKQYIGGSLFKSQNGTIWTASQYQDLKFKLYKAKFTSRTGEVVFYNPPIRPTESTIPTLKSNPIRVLPRKLKVGIETSNSLSSILTSGRKVSSLKNTQTGVIGYVENNGGPAYALSISGVGTGYLDGSYTNVPLYPITGFGDGITADLTISGKGLSSVSIASSGSGYSVGDVLGITTGAISKGTGARITVSQIYGIDTLYLNNVKGETFESGSELIYYNNNSPVSSGLSARNDSVLISNLYTGGVFEVTHYNHGMHGQNNIVSIANVESDTEPVVLNAPLGINDSFISVANTNPFGSFEGISTSTGYLKINNEIIFYNSITNGTLGIGSRGVDNTSVQYHSTSSVAKKYEANGVSLRRINTTHDMTTPENVVLNDFKELDKYYLSITSRGTGNKQISFNDEKTLGGIFVSASQNYQFSSLVPNFNVVTPGQSTTVSAKIRTTSATSSGGSEISFNDQGFENIQINKVNFFPTPRLVASEVNETVRLSNNKSLTTILTLNSGDENLSPVIDIQNSFMVLGRNRVNSPIKDYAFDGRVNLNSGDPHSSLYISKRMNLKQAATGLKVYIAAYRPAEADFRVLYKTYKTDSSEIEPSFTLFPGYENLKNKGNIVEVIDPAKNNGKPDIYVRPSLENEYLEYEFTADNLEQFIGYSIKIVFSTTNESKVPSFNDIRVIALA